MAENKPTNTTSFWDVVLAFMVFMVCNPIGWIVGFLFLGIGIPLLILTCGAFIDGIFGTAIVEHLREAWKPS